MAQSRLNKAASIYKRTTGLIESNLIPWKDRPLWYDIYKAFPPTREPQYRSVLAKDPIPPLPRKIFYKDDELRAFYFKNITGTDTIVLNSTKTKPKWEIFIEVYKRLASHGISKENLVNATIEEMQNRGFFVKLKKGDSSDQDIELLNEESSHTAADNQLESNASSLSASSYKSEAKPEATIVDRIKKEE